nr:CPCC family cysteine-rich protein [Metabacillus halosaccharovorans]
MRGEIVKYTCPCCGYKTLDEEPPNTYDICEICFWEDDGFQYKYPDETGANYVSFREAQQNFLKFGAKGERSLKFVRYPNKSDIKDPNWEPL